MKNILLLNAGTRNTLIQDFRKTAGGQLKIVATDSYELAPALYDADAHYVTKHWTEDGYWNEIEQICQKEDIGLILSLVDPELDMLAERKEHFESQGILVNIAEIDTISKTFDKYETIQFLKDHGYNYIKSYIDYVSAADAIASEIVHFPLITKPRKGSGSAGIEIVNSLKRLEEICALHDDILIQEFIDGQEIGADVFIDLLSNRVVSIFTKKKLKMRSGETDKSVSFKDEKLFELIGNFAQDFKLRGVNDIDIFIRDGEYYISEVNPRFGGGYLHAYAAGVDFPRLLMTNMKGMKNAPEIGAYEDDLYMMKYFDIKIRKKEEIYETK